jgi:hypothetical protein
VVDSIDLEYLAFELFSPSFELCKLHENAGVPSVDPTSSLPL